MKNKILRLLLSATLVIMMSACASVPLAPPETDMRIKNIAPPPDKALLYVYRDNLFVGSAVMLDVYIDEQRIDGHLAVNTFLVVALEAGEHSFSYAANHLAPSAISSAVAEDYLTINISAGKKYYIEISALSGPSETEMVNATSDAFNGSKLILKSGKPATITTATIKKREVSSPAFEQRQAVKSDVDILALSGVRTNKNNYAIVIGIEEYREKLPKADFAAADANLVAEYLTKSLGVPEENLVILINGKATKSDMEKYFYRWLQNNVTKESDVFIYFSGHGAPNPSHGDAFLVPYDGDPTYIAETGYPLNRLYDILGRLPSRQNMVILDSCFSGAGGRSVIAEGLRPLVVTAAEQKMIAPNTVVLSASAGNQVSSTYLDKGHGLLTYFILKGLKEETVVDQEGSLDMKRLYLYVKENVGRVSRKQYNNEQTPQLIGVGTN